MKAFLLILTVLWLGNNAYASDTSNCKLIINPSVFVHDSNKLEGIVKSLQHLVCATYEESNKSLLWEDGVMDRWVVPYNDQYFFGYSPTNNEYKYYQPTLLSAQELEKDIFSLKVAYMRGNSAKNATLKIIYNYILNTQNGVHKFIPTIDYNTSDYNKTQVGNIQFVFADNHIFNKELAQQSDSFNTYIADFFETDTLLMDYYITNSTAAFFSLRGYDFEQSMFIENQSSGLADNANRKVYSGNGTEWYPHELVHLYVFEKFQKDTNNIHLMFNEGLATWLGGSMTKDIKWHVRTLKDYIQKENPDLNNINEMQFAISDFSNMHYTVGAVLTEQAYKMYGKEKLWALVDNSNSEELVYNNICKVFGVDRDEVGKLILELLDKY